MPFQCVCRVFVHWGAGSCHPCIDRDPTPKPGVPGVESLHVLMLILTRGPKGPPEEFDKKTEFFEKITWFPSVWHREGCDRAEGFGLVLVRRVHPGALARALARAFERVRHLWIYGLGVSASGFACTVSGVGWGGSSAGLLFWWGKRRSRRVNR